MKTDGDYNVSICNAFSRISLLVTAGEWRDGLGCLKLTLALICNPFLVLIFLQKLHKPYKSGSGTDKTM